VTSALAAVAGGLYGSFQGFVTPADFGLLLSIQYIAIIIVGGVGTIFGSVVGAIALGATPRIIEQVSRNNDLPFVEGDRGGVGGSLDFISVASLNKIIFGVVIVLFLIFEPHGLAAVWLRIKAYFRTWPFSY
jgi:branched-chain amino acid transport system permease protein